MDNILDLVQEKWKQLTAFSKKQEIKDLLWDEILYRYSERHRHYHNLNHLAHLFSLCDRNIERIKNPALVGFAIFYHDIVYDTYREDNEEQSAVIAGEHLKELSINTSLIENVQTFIRATKSHDVAESLTLNGDLALFLDFDMAILAEEPDMYKLYSEKIRLEYSKYPDNLYKEGRKLALQKILALENIFATELFRNEMEGRARRNIGEELGSL